MERGRHVYIAEGCINCHSQYVRPNTTDVAMWGPAGMPAEIVNKINADTRKALADPVVKSRLQSLGNDTMDMSPQEFAKLVRNEMDDYARVLKAAGIKPQ